MLQDGPGLVLLDALRHHVQDVVLSTAHSHGHHHAFILRDSSGTEKHLSQQLRRIRSIHVSRTQGNIEKLFTGGSEGTAKMHMDKNSP